MSTSVMSSQVVIPTLIATLGLLVFRLSTNSPDATSISIIRKSEMEIIGLPDRTRLQERLEKLGRGDQYGHFRLRQCAIASAGTFLMAAVLFSIGGSASMTALISIGTYLGVHFVVDRRLNAELARYRLGVESEFAAVIEMLTLSLSAGETPLAAMSRISQHSKSTLAQEFRTVVDSVRKGFPFHVALDDMGRRVDSAVIRRFVDALITAMLRGAPLVDVLQRHAAEARQNQRNILMDKAGRAELSMMVPVVFLILPVSVLFALWPSLTNLNLFAS